MTMTLPARDCLKQVGLIDEHFTDDVPSPKQSLIGYLSGRNDRNPVGVQIFLVERGQIKGARWW